jgi:predicted RNA-binding protein
MRYWLCVTNQENWEVIKEKNIWGVEERHRNTISKVRPGDKLLVYMMTTKKENETLPPRIVAAYEVVSEMFTDSSRIFKGKLYPLRIGLRLIAVFSKPLDFRELVSKLSFIKNKRMWVGHIRGKAMREIPKEDFETVLEVVGVKGCEHD